MVPQLCQTIVLINAFPALHKPLVASYPDSSPHKAKPLVYLFTAASSDIICAQISQKLLLLLSPRLIKTLPFFSCAIFEQCSGMVYSFNVPEHFPTSGLQFGFKAKSPQRCTETLKNITDISACFC